MEWTKEDAAFLRNYRKTLDSDDIKLKEEIKQRLLNDKYIIHVLNNKELEAADAEPDDYFGINILPYYYIPSIQTHVDNFICYECHSEPRSRWDATNVEKYQRIIFYILCESKNMIDKETSLARHDLLGALILRAFNFEIFSCGRIHCMSDVPGVVDNNYISRVMTFTCKTDANLVKTIDNIPRIVNKKVNF